MFLGALTAIEQDDLDSLRMILSKNSVPVNDSLIENAFYSQFPCKVTLLDVALMFNRLNAASLLLQHEATENLQLSDISKRKQIVDEVLLDYETRFRQMKMKSLSNKEDEKRLRTMEHHLNSLKKMKSVLDKPEMPGSPVDVKVYVAATTRATIEFNAPGTSGNCIITKYKVEWSKTSSFEEIEGSQIVYDMRETAITISNLVHGKCYTFRISAGSMWGFGEPIVALPKNLRISSWEDCANIHPERVVSMRAMAELHSQVEKYRQSAVWQVVFPNNGDGAIKKKKTGLRNLFSASSKFIKNVGRGLYFASLIYTEDKILCTVDDCLPVIQIDDSMISVPMDDMEWLMKLSLCWDQVNYLQDSSGGTWSSNSPFRAKVLEAVAAMHNALGVKDIGRIHHIPLTYSAATTFIVSVHFVTENQATQSQGLAMRWMKLNKIMRKKSSSTPLDFLCKEMVPVLNFFESSQIPLDRGLYLGYLKMQSSLNTIRVTVPDNMPSALPYVTIRSTPHVSQEEWEWIQTLDSDENEFSRPTPTQHAFHQQLMRATEMILRDLDLDSDLIRHHRLFKFQVLQLHPDVSFILIFPRAEDVCQVHASYSAIDEYNDRCKGCASIPIPVFEMISFSTYQPDFIATYCRMNIFIEHFITIIKYEIRQCLHEKDARVYNEQLEKLNEFQTKLEDIWRSARWISNIATVARERQTNCGISLSYILNQPPPALPGDNASDVGYHSDPQNKNHEVENGNIDVTPAPTNDAPAIIRRANFRNSKTNNNDSTASSREPLSRSKSVVERGEIRLASIDKMFQEDNLYTLSEAAGKAEAANKLQSDSTTLDYLARKFHQIPSPSRLSGIIRVFAAYDCALPKNTAIRLSITQATTAREVVALVVEQINKLTLLSDDNDNKLSQLQDFCLVSVVGARERRLRDEFQPMRLLPPWTRGRLFVRRCDSATAAIRFGNETFV
uniref:Fibronectin type-III domain-containing protein n=1 Tax=Panagrolaimus superbus TaxID=310955 RepID=A0A914ZD59_9BILA